MTITWYGHSCFMLESPSGTVVLDPYSPGSVPGLSLPPLTADMVLCSHEHKDHCRPDAVSLTGGAGEMCVERLGSWHDDADGEKRGPNTIHVIEADGFRVAHLGDLGHELTAGQIRAVGKLDALMIPVGGYYTIDAVTAKRVADQIGAAVTIPMHYRGDGFGFDVISPVSDFTELCSDVVYADGSSITLSRGEEKKTVVLKVQK